MELFSIRIQRTFQLVSTNDEEGSVINLLSSFIFYDIYSAIQHLYWISTSSAVPEDSTRKDTDVGRPSGRPLHPEK